MTFGDTETIHYEKESSIATEELMKKTSDDEEDDSDSDNKIEESDDIQNTALVSKIKNADGATKAKPVEPEKKSIAQMLAKVDAKDDDSSSYNITESGSLKESKEKALWPTKPVKPEAKPKNKESDSDYMDSFEQDDFSSTG